MNALLGSPVSEKLRSFFHVFVCTKIRLADAATVFQNLLTFFQAIGPSVFGSNHRRGDRK